VGGPLSKLCVTPPFSIIFRCQIENQVSDYRLLEKTINLHQVTDKIYSKQKESHKNKVICRVGKKSQEKTSQQKSHM
jgi:hypothetical protein